MNCEEILELDTPVHCEFNKNNHPKDYHQGLFTTTQVSTTKKTGIRAIGEIQWRSLRKEELEGFLEDAYKRERRKRT